MKTIIKYLLITAFCLAFQSSARADVYLVIWATYDGYSGHAAIAIDNYNEVVRDEYQNGKLMVNYDSVANGTLSFFDLWPKNDDFTKTTVDSTIEARYNSLPASSSQGLITPTTLAYRGLPYINLEACDGIIRIPTTPAQDFRLKNFLKNEIEGNKPFQARINNCADFAEKAIEYLLDTEIYADEYIPFQFSTTPNKLYKAVAELPSVKIMLDPGHKVDGSFWKEKILKRHNLNF